MSKLNPGILEEIFNEVIKNFSLKPRYYKRKIMVDNSLTNFMLSGKKQFNIALNYFGRAKSALVENDDITIDIPNAVWGYKKSYSINYDYPLLKPLLSAIGASIGHLSVMELPHMAEERHVLDYLIGEGLKQVNVETGLTFHHNDLLRASNTIETVELNNDLIEDIILNLTMISSSCQQLDIRGSDFIKLFQIRPIKFTFNSVKTFNVSLHFTEHDFYADKIKNVADFLSPSFPNLEQLNFEIMLDSAWSKIKDTVFALEHSNFQYIHLNVKGCINIHNQNFDAGPLEDAPQDIADKPNMTFDAQNRTIQKIFEIHDGLDFKFNYHFSPELFDDEMDDFDDEVMEALDDAVIHVRWQQ